MGGEAVFTFIDEYVGRYGRPNENKPLTQCFGIVPYVTITR